MTTGVTSVAGVSPYSALPMEGPYEVAIGWSLITLVEPDDGHEAEYNRWYEDEHFYSGAMAMPWLFAGRRWVAPCDLQALRYPEDSLIAQPLSRGKYVSVYWITAGRYEDHFAWTYATHVRSMPDGRVDAGWASVFTSFQVYAGPVYRDAKGPRDIHALDYPYQGLVVEVVDPAEDRDELERWLRDEFLPERLAGSPVAMTLLFESDPRSASRAGEQQPGPDQQLGPEQAATPERFRKMEERMADHIPGLERLVTLVSFTEVPPPECWPAVFAGAGERIAASGRGRVVFASPFYPTLPGTETYVDRLR